MANNNVMGMWGATDLNDLIRGLKMVLAQAEDVRACGGTLADMQSIGTCGTCSMHDAILCEDAPADCHGCDDYDYEEDEFWGADEETTLDDLVRLLRENM